MPLRRSSQSIAQAGRLMRRAGLSARGSSAFPAPALLSSPGPRCVKTDQVAQLMGDDR